MRTLLVLALLAPLVLGQPAVQPSQLPLSLITLPEGFNISLYTDQTVTDARQLALSQGFNSEFPNAVIIYVGSNGPDGVVSALVDPTGTGNITVVPVLSNLDRPNGVAWHNSSLFVAEVTTISRFDDVDSYALAGRPFPAGQTLSTAFVDQNDHQVHFLGVGPDEKLYIPQGSPSNTGPCNVVGDIRQCAINRMNLDGSDLEVYVTGVRNSVGFDWDDADNLWASSNARDNLDPDHNNRPDDPLLFIPDGTEPNTLDFGYPYCHWQGSGDPLIRSVGAGIPVVDDVNTPAGVTDAAQYQAFCSNVTNNQAPAQSLGPHVAALGVRFYRGDLFPSDYNQSLFIALHGSWNRDQKIGYKVVKATVDANGTVTSYSTFAQGWLQNADGGDAASVWGRPVDVQPLRDGSLLVSDDAAGVIYRITYSPPSTVVTNSLTG